MKTQKETPPVNKFLDKEGELLEYLTGTTTPLHLTEREKVMVYKFLQWHDQQNAEYIEALREGDRLPSDRINPAKIAEEISEFVKVNMEEYAMQFTKEFTQWRDAEAWEYDHREQHTHTLQEQIDIFKNIQWIGKH